MDRIQKNRVKFSLILLMGIFIFLFENCGRPVGTVSSTGTDFSSFTLSAPPSYSLLFQKIFSPRCLSCHSGPNAPLGIDLSTYSTMMASQAVVPKNANSSLLYIEISRMQMPPVPPPLSTDEINAIYFWIQSGAPDDTAGPTLISVSPTSGSTNGGTQIQLTGTGFQAGATVQVGGANCSNLNLLSATTLTCITSSHGAGIVDIVLSLPNGKTSKLASAYTFTSTAVTGPTVSGISPTSGSSGGGTTVTLTGSNFQSGATVSMGGLACGSTTFVSSSKITCVTPIHASGPVAVIVVNPGGQSSTSPNEYIFVLTSTYRSIYVDILTPRCLHCHNTNPLPNHSPSTVLDFSTYNSIMATNVIVPGDPTIGSLYGQIGARGGTIFMPPPSDIPPNRTTNSTENAAIHDWILGGALNN